MPRACAISLSFSTTSTRAALVNRVAVSKLYFELAVLLLQPTDLFPSFVQFHEEVVQYNQSLKLLFGLVCDLEGLTNVFHGILAGLGS